jgi:UDP-glucose 4-epimerase
MDYTVIGSKGFIGSRLCTSLKKLGLEYWAPEKQSEEILSRELGCVFYCAGLTADYSEVPFDTIRAHVSYLSHILEKGKYDHLVYLSSTRLYDTAELEIANEDAILKFSTLNPSHLYDLSKALGENLCMTASYEKTSIARLSSVYDWMPNAPGFLSGILSRIRYETEFLLESSSGYCRDYISLNDTVSALISIGRNQTSGIINVANGRNVYNHEIADYLSKFGYKIKFSKYEDDIILPTCNVDRLKKMNIKPRDIFENIRDYLEV